MEQAADRYTPVMAQWGNPDPRQASEYPRRQDADGAVGVGTLRRRPRLSQAMVDEPSRPYLEEPTASLRRSAWERDKEKRSFDQAAMAWQSCRSRIRLMFWRETWLHSTTGGFNRAALSARCSRRISSLSSLARCADPAEGTGSAGAGTRAELPDELGREILEPPPWPLGEHNAG